MSESIILDSVTKSTRKSNRIKKANVYEYQVKAPSGPSGLYRGWFLMRPWLAYFIANVVGFLSLTAIGYGICVAIGASSAKFYGDYCYSTSDCSQAYNLICSKNRCSCSSSTYYQTPSCVNQLGYLVQCSGTYNECGYGTVCSYSQSSNSLVCNCTSNRFWSTSSSYCLVRVNYGLSGCSSSSDCVTGSNLVCNAGTCTCATNRFWNGTYCDTIKGYMSNCTIDQGCDSSQSLICSQFNSTVNVCTCSITQYWLASSSKCVNKFSNGVACTTTTECRSDLGLICSGSVCTCSPNNYYWTGSTCSAKNLYTIPCSASSPCDDTKNFICLGTNRCGCPTGYFYNGTACQTFLDYGYSCAGSFSSGCDSSKNMVCNAGSKVCICNSNRYYNSITCVNQFSNGATCSQTVQCLTSKNLACQSGTCQCTSGLTWDSALSNCV